MNEDRYYQSWPDFTVGDNETDAASCFAHSIEFMDDQTLAQGAVMFMKMAAFGIKTATHENPYIVEAQGDESKYYQLIRGSNGEFYSELSAPEASGQEPDQAQRDALAPLGWTMPNEDSPNYHREYQADAGRYDIAADAARGWFKAYNS